MTKRRRGGYTNGSQTHELKFRATPSLFETIQGISEQTEASMALVLRELVSEALAQRNSESNHVSKA